MKLKEWANLNDISYITAWRWFKENRLPVKARQMPSGTIIVEDLPLHTNEEASNQMGNISTMGDFINKTVEYSKENKSIADFASYILANFQLTPLNSVTNKASEPNVPKKPHGNLKNIKINAQEHFKDFIENVKKPKPQPNMFLPDTIDLSENISSDELRGEPLPFNPALKETINSVKIDKPYIKTYVENYMKASPEEKAKLDEAAKKNGEFLLSNTGDSGLLGWQSVTTPDSSASAVFKSNPFDFTNSTIKSDSRPDLSTLVFNSNINTSLGHNVETILSANYENTSIKNLASGIIKTLNDNNFDVSDPAVQAMADQIYAKAELGEPVKEEKVAKKRGRKKKL